MAIIDGLNKVFESKIRLGIMSVLVANGSADFATLKSLLELTDGNLASHTRHLEDDGLRVVLAVTRVVGVQVFTNVDFELWIFYCHNFFLS